MYRMELALIIVMGVNDLHARFLCKKTSLFDFYTTFHPFNLHEIHRKRAIQEMRPLPEGNYNKCPLS